MCWTDLTKLLEGNAHLPLTLGYQLANFQTEVQAILTEIIPGWVADQLELKTV